MTEPALMTANEQQPHVDPAVVERVRSLCLALPGTSEKEAWGDPSFRVAGRMFGIIKFGGQCTSLWLAASDGAQEALVESDPSRFFNPSSHPIHRGWIGVRLDAPPAVDWDEVGFLVAQAHEVTSARTGPPRRTGTER